MKKSLKRILYLTPMVYAIILMGFAIFAGCNKSEPKMGTYAYVQENAKKPQVVVDQESKAGKILKGEHKLAFIKDDKYFYVHHSPNFSSLICSFIWETNDGFYSTNYVYFSDIRFVIDSNVTEPYIKYNWDSSNSNANIQAFVWNINYMVVVTNNMNFQELISYENYNGQNVSSDN